MFSTPGSFLLTRNTVHPLVVLLILASAVPAAPVRHGDSPRLGGELARVAALAGQGLTLAAMPADAAPVLTRGGRVQVELSLASWDDDTLQRLAAAGLDVETSSARWQMATAWVAPRDLRAVSEVAELAVMRPFQEPVLSVGATTSQADLYTGSNTARLDYGVNGAGYQVGVLSDSFFATIGGTLNGTTLTGSSPQLTGDLPAQVTVLDNGTGIAGLTDEGAAMAEHVYDLAPGAGLAFHTAFRGQTDFANGILELRNVAGCDVIVDDVFYLSEPFFQDGPIAQAVEQVVALGVPYFSSAGNLGRVGVLDTYRDVVPGSNTPGVDPPNGNELHDWTGMGQPFARVTIPSGRRVRFILQWSEPFAGALGPGSQGDFDLVLYRSASVTSQIIAFSTNAQGVEGAPSGDPLEILDFTANASTNGDFFLAMNWFRGRRDNVTLRVVPVVSGSGVTFDGAIFNDMTTFGHSAAVNASSVAAIDYFEIEQGGNVYEIPGRFDVEPFSSLGGNLPYFFSPTGTALPGAPQLRFKPDIAAPDGCNTTFFGQDRGGDADSFPNFFGTSAAAPHAAAVATLLLDRMDNFGLNLTPAQVYTVLNSTSIDIQDPGRDPLGGFGTVWAPYALAPPSSVIADDILDALPSPAGADVNRDGVVNAADIVARRNQGI